MIDSTFISVCAQICRRHFIPYVVVPLKAEQADAAREAYVKAHPTAFWAQFGDFKMYGMTEMLDVSFVGGFARAGGVTVDEYLEASVDPCLRAMSPPMWSQSMRPASTGAAAQAARRRGISIR